MDTKEPIGSWSHHETPPKDWRPASLEDARLLRLDFELYGNAFATWDGRRIDPRDIIIEDGEITGVKFS